VYASLQVVAIFSQKTLGMRQAIALLLLGVIVIVIIVVNKRTQESFTGNESQVAGEIACPISAVRTPEGKIKIQPGDQTFNTIQDYVAYLSGLYSQGSKCIPPMIANNKEPIDMIMGGLGVGAPSANDVAREGAAREVLNTDLHGEQTSAKTPIDKLDDYEYTRVYESERNNRNETNVGTINNLMEGRKLDWANLPFNSETHAAGADEFVAGRLDTAFQDPKSGVFFKNLDDSSALPPDADAEKAREQKILAAYRPTDITEHVVDTRMEQVGKLVHQMYENDPNWTPVVERVDENNYRIVELRPKARKEQYEEAKTQSLSMLEEKGDVIPPPQVSIEDRMRSDPYFDKGGVGDRDNNKFWNYNDFKKWTPGLERMFAPTMDNKEWY
jgi:hypothetical protein